MHHVAIALYFLGIYQRLKAKINSGTLGDYIDVVILMELMALILIWPLWAAISMVYDPIYWLVTYRWPVCNICHHKSHVVIGHRAAKYCPDCYNRCVDSPDRVLVQTSATSR